MKLLCRTAPNSNNSTRFFSTKLLQTFNVKQEVQSSCFRKPETHVRRNMTSKKCSLTSFQPLFRFNVRCSDSSRNVEKLQKICTISQSVQSTAWGGVAKYQLLLWNINLLTTSCEVPPEFQEQNLCKNVCDSFQQEVNQSGSESVTEGSAVKCCALHHCVLQEIFPQGKFSSGLEECEWVLPPVCCLNVSLLMIQTTLSEPSTVEEGGGREERRREEGGRRLLVALSMLIVAQLKVRGSTLQCFLDAHCKVAPGRLFGSVF